MLKEPPDGGEGAAGGDLGGTMELLGQKRRLLIPSHAEACPGHAPTRVPLFVSPSPGRSSVWGWPLSPDDVLGNLHLDPGLPQVGPAGAQLSSELIAC